MSKPIRVLVADDHPIVRQGLALLCATQPDIQVVAEAANGAEAIRLAEQYTPDVLVLDLIMPGTDGLTALQQVRQRQPATRILIFTSFAEEAHVTAAFAVGIEGFQLKDSTPKTLLNAIRAVYQGEPAIHPVIIQQMIQSYRKSETQTRLERLTEREVDVLQHLGQGLSNREIAAQLIVSTRTVTTHVRNIMIKLELSNRTQIALFARSKTAQLHNL